MTGGARHIWEQWPLSNNGQKMVPIHSFSSALARAGLSQAWQTALRKESSGCLFLCLLIYESQCWYKRGSGTVINHLWFVKTLRSSKRPVLQWEVSLTEKSHELSDTKHSRFLKGYVPAQMFHRRCQDKEQAPLFGESVTARNTINTFPYVWSLNSEMLILQPRLQIRPQKLTRRLSKQRSLSVCSGEDAGRLETMSNKTKLVWIHGCEENTEGQMKSDTLQIPPWQRRSHVLSGTASAPSERPATGRQKWSEIQL